MALGAVVGRLVDMERGQAHDAEERAAEAERLRDELGRRVDLLEATNRAARALGSSLDLDGRSPRSCASCAACCRSTAPRSCSPRRRCPRDGDRGRRRSGLSRAGDRDHGAGRDPRSGDRGGAHDLPRGHRRGAVPGGSRAARARRPRAGARAAAARNALDRRPRDRTNRAGVLQRGGGRAGDVPRAARRDGSAEPAHVRGRARDGRRAAAALRRSAPTSSRSSRTSCAARWLR